MFKYLRIFSNIIIKSKYRFHFALLLGVMIITSILLVTCYYVNAQELESITQYGKVKDSLEDRNQIMVGNHAVDIQINGETNKIYVANEFSNSISVIDGASGKSKSVHVGADPRSIAIDDLLGKIYVANTFGDTVSVIDGYNDSKIKDIHLGKEPFDLVVHTNITLGNYKIYVANVRNNTVSVINSNTDTKERDIPVGISPYHIALDRMD